MRSRLDLIESRLERFIESSLNFLPGARKQDALARQLVEAIEQTASPNGSGEWTAPGLYLIRIHPVDLSAWNASPGLIESLARALNDAAREVGVSFLGSPTLQFQADPSIPANHFVIVASPRESGLDETAALTLQDEKAAQEGLSSQAFCILNGETLPLNQPVMNIGRRQDNQIVVNDPRVSRAHAQLRFVRGHFVVFDLNSTGGTFVNGVRVSQQVLKPGDVISLAGFPIIYGEENAQSPAHRGDLSTGRLDIQRPDLPIQ